jgi:hypothetical protein
MSIAAAKGMTAKEAIDCAMGFFYDFYDDNNFENVLLEELEFDDSKNAWFVRIGFDIGRKKMRQPTQNALAAMFDQEIVPIRESRLFEISDADGALLRMGDD